MTDFQSFRNAVLEDDDLQEQVISIINTATANGSGMGDGIATLVASISALTTCSEKQGFQFGWKSRQSISPSVRSKWDGKNENAEAIIALLDGDWQRQDVDGESNLLMMKGKINGDMVSVAVRNSGTQAKTTVSIRSTGTHLPDLLEEVFISNEN